MGFCEEFIQANYEQTLDSLDKVRMIECYPAYLEACKKWNVKPLHNSPFGKIFRRLFPNTKRYQRTMKDKSYDTYYNFVKRRKMPYQIVDMGGSPVCDFTEVRKNNKFVGKMMTQEFVKDEIMALYGQIDILLKEANTPKQKLEAAVAKERLLDKCAKITGSYKEEERDLANMNHILNLASYERGLLTSGINKVLDQMCGKTKEIYKPPRTDGRIEAREIQ